MKIKAQTFHTVDVEFELKSWFTTGYVDFWREAMSQIRYLEQQQLDEFEEEQRNGA